MMLFPSIADYKQAVMIPDSFASLTHLTPVMGQLGDVYFSSGNFAVVFKMRDSRTQAFKALKCFTRPQERRTESLLAISAHLARMASPFVVPYQFLDNEIWINDAEYPVVLMDWVEGMTLGEKVKALCETQNTEGLHRLSVVFAGLAVDLLAQGWAHGDLKHDNIIVRPDDSLALVDYDGCFVPSMAGQMAREIGSPCYRHPKRTMEHFDRHIDNFSILIIFLSLRALAQAPQWFQAYQNGENLVLSVQDLAEPQLSPLLTQLRQSEDNYLKGALGLFEFAVAMRSGAVFGLNEGLLAEFFGVYKNELLSKTVVLRCVNYKDEIVVFEVDRDIKVLDLCEKRLKRIPAEIGQLTSLTRLAIDNNQLTSIPAEIGQLTNLTELYLYENQLTSIPFEIGQLWNLNILRLDGNQLTFLPSEIEQLMNLTHLDLDNNQLTSIPSEIGKLSNLVGLDLRNNYLTSLPSEIGQFKKLKNLYLARNPITELPFEIKKLTELEDFDMKHLPYQFSKIVLVFERQGKENLVMEVDSNIMELDLRGKSIEKLPPEIGQLTNLTTLNLGVAIFANPI